MIGHKGNEIVAEVAPQPGDVFIEKRKPSAFFGTPLMSYLTNMGADSLILTGTTTSGCVRASAVDALSYDLQVTIPGRGRLRSRRTLAQSRSVRSAHEIRRRHLWPTCSAISAGSPPVCSTKPIRQRRAAAQSGKRMRDRLSNSMAVIEEIMVPAGDGRGVVVNAGQLLDIIDVEGQQVGDLVAWRRDDPGEYMSPTHTVSCNASIKLKVGDQVFTNRRNPIFTILRDDVGQHDIIVPCCDHERYARDFKIHDHRSCLGNLLEARDLLGAKFDIRGEQAWNIFMHNRVTPEGAVVTDAAAHPRAPPLRCVPRWTSWHSCRPARRI